jgi:sugar (pentulose or hexulose) kinase
MRENNRNRTFMGNGVSGGLLMGIDLGSSCFKVDLFDADLHRVGGAAAPVVYDIHDNCVEMPVADCEQTLRRAIADAKQESGCSPSDICAVAFSSQAQTFTVRTPEGAAKIPFISWRDHRSFPGNPTNDLTAGAYSAGIHESQSLLISLGTAQVAYLSLPFMPQPKPGTMRGDYLEDRYYQLTADDLGAGSISWACSVLPGCANPADFDRLAASAPAGCHGVRFVADGPAGSGHWIGIEHAQATTADKARAVLEILVERMADMIGNLNPLQTECGVLVCGGGAKSELWLSMLSSRLERPLVRTEAVSPSAGAAKMARNVLE